MAINGNDVWQKFADERRDVLLVAVVRGGEHYIALYDDDFASRCGMVETLAAWERNPELSFNASDLRVMARKILA